MELDSSLFANEQLVCVLYAIYVIVFYCVLQKNVCSAVVKVVQGPSQTLFYHAYLH